MRKRSIEFVVTVVIDEDDYSPDEIDEAPEILRDYLDEKLNDPGLHARMTVVPGSGSGVVAKNSWTFDRSGEDEAAANRIWREKQGLLAD